MQRYIQQILFGTVFTTGASVLIVEVAAVRLLAPYFGASMYVLSSVLTIVLLALGLGYYVGGRLSDRYPSYTLLYSIITCSGFVLLLLISVALYAMPIFAPGLPLLFGPLFFSTLFFFLPAFLLGIDSPFVIKLLSKQVADEERGAVVGETFFWSTAGSIVGSLASGFILIPYLGLIESFLATGIILTVLGISGWLITCSAVHDYGSLAPKMLFRPSLIISAATLFLAALTYVIVTHTAHANAVYEDDGYYSHIHIYDAMYLGMPARFLKRDINNSSAIFLDRNDLVFMYAQFAPLYTYLKPGATSFLMLGGGAYTIPRAINKIDPELEIDVVELEPSLYQLAKKYFRLPDTEKIQNHVIDARSYLLRTEKQYDVIFADISSSGHYLPQHLMTQEYLELIRSRLNDNGVVIFNLLGGREKTSDQTLTGSFTKTVAEVFPNFVVYRAVAADTEVPQNLIFIMRNGDEPIVLPSTYVITDYQQNYLLGELKLDPTKLISANDTIFTDNDSQAVLLHLKLWSAYR